MSVYDTKIIFFSYKVLALSIEFHNHSFFICNLFNIMKSMQFFT